MHPAQDSPESHYTFHLVPRPQWDMQAEDGTYTPASLKSEGFIHCTDGAGELIKTANRYYVGLEGDVLALVIDRRRVRSPIRYDDPGRIYPHIYGPLNPDAVVAVRQLARDPDGRYPTTANQTLSDWD